MAVSHNKKYHTQGGSSIFLGLFAILVISGYILVNINVDRDRIVQERVDQTAWLIEQVAEAARLYVRDQNVAGNGLFQKAALCTTPRQITVSDLISNGYIGVNIGERNVTGTNFVTPLDQVILIIAANSEINLGACGPTQLDNVAPTAYLVLHPPMQGVENFTLALLAESLAQRGMPVGSPIFDGAGNNTSETCATGPATIQWDTGCLDNTQFSFLTGGLAFGDSFMGVPAWLTFRGDNRAVFRYEQAENPASNQMQTDMVMAMNFDPATCANLLYTAPDEAQLSTNPTATRNLDSGVCDVPGDTSADNNRFNLTNVRTLETNRALVVPQATDFGGDTGDDFISSGASVITGGVRAYNAGNAIQMGDLDLASGTGQSLTIAPRDAAAIAPRAQVNSVTAGLAQSNNITVGTTSSSGDTFVLDQLNSIGGSLTVTDATDAGRGVVINNMSGTTAAMGISGNAIFGGDIDVSGQATINGGGALPVAAVFLFSDDMVTNGEIEVGESLSVGGTVNTGISSVGQCLDGDCPDRSPDPEAPL